MAQAGGGRSSNSLPCLVHPPLHHYFRAELLVYRWVRDGGGCRMIFMDLMVSFIMGDYILVAGGCLLMHPRRRPCGRRKRISRDRAQKDFGPSRVRADRDPCFSLRTSIGDTCCITRYAPSRTKATHATTSRRLQHRARATSRSRSSCRCTCVSRLLRTVLGQGRASAPHGIG